MKKVELENLGITIEVDKFQEEFKEKNLNFFKLLDNAGKDDSIKVFHAISEEEYYNLIVVLYNNTYNAFPEPMFLEYMTLENLNNKIQLEEISREEIDKIIRSQRDNSFSYLRNKEDKAQLILKLIKLTNGKLTNNELEEIVNNIDMDISFKIRVIDNAKDFAESITLKSYEYNNNCDIRQYWLNVFLLKTEEEKENYFVIDDGNFIFGIQNEFENEEIKPNFNINKKCAVLVETKTIEINEDDLYEFELIIYLPESEPYKIDDKIKYILENFKI